MLIRAGLCVIAVVGAVLAVRDAHDEIADCERRAATWG